MTNKFVAWEHPPIHTTETGVQPIPEFKPRGMTRLYSRVDHFGARQPAFHLDLWKNRKGQFFARFWSRGGDVETESYQIAGFAHQSLSANDERWVPIELRDRYAGWVQSMIGFR